jgi:hypothetical protein
MPSSTQSQPLVVKIVNGDVRLYAASGNYLRTLCSGGVAAVVQGDQVHVTGADGTVRVYRTSGHYLRTI